MAEAQRWRTRIVEAELDELASWQARIEQLPESLRPGPTFVWAQALQRVGRPEDAALAYLRVALMSEHHDELAAESLFAAGRRLDQAGRAGEADRIFRELRETYPASSWAAESSGQ